LKGSANWKESYQDLGRIACFTDVFYNKNRDEANVGVKCRHHSSYQSSDLEYSFDNGQTFGSENKYVAKADKDTSVMKV